MGNWVKWVNLMLSSTLLRAESIEKYEIDI